MPTKGKYVNILLPKTLNSLRFPEKLQAKKPLSIIANNYRNIFTGKSIKEADMQEINRIKIKE